MEQIQAAEISEERPARRTRTNALSSHQLIAMTFIIGFGLNMLNLPAVLVMDGGRDGWLAMLFITAVDCVALYFTLLVMRRFREVNVSGKAYKIIRTVLAVVFLIWSLGKLMLIIGEARMFFGKTVFANLDWLVFLGLLGALAAILGAGGGRALGRLCELFLPIAAVAVIMLVVMSYSGGTHFSDVLPILHNNADVLKCPIKYALWTGNYPVLCVLFRNAEFKKHTCAVSTAAAGISGIMAAALTFALSAAYGNMRQLIYYGSNAADMNQYVSNYNVGRIDLIVFTVWSVVLLIESGIFQHAAVECVSAIIPKSYPHIYSVAVGVVVYVLMNLLVPCDVRLFTFATKYMPYYSLAVQTALPAVGAAAVAVHMIACRKRKRRQN